MNKAHGAESPSASSTRARARRALRVSARKGLTNEPRQPKRAAIVLRRGMKQKEFQRVEAQFAAHDVAWLPILAEDQRRQAPVAASQICGLVVTGSDMPPTDKEVAAIVSAVQENIGRRAPVLAMSNAIELVLDAAGFAAPDEEHKAVLLHRGVEVLESRGDIEDAIDRMAKRPTSDASPSPA